MKLTPPTAPCNLPPCNLPRACAPPSRASCPPALTYSRTHARTHALPGPSRGHISTGTRRRFRLPAAPAPRAGSTNKRRRWGDRRGRPPMAAGRRCRCYGGGGAGRGGGRERRATPHNTAAANPRAAPGEVRQSAPGGGRDRPAVGEAAGQRDAKGRRQWGRGL